MKINKKLTRINFNKGKNKKNKFIVIHYVGATGTAEANCKYFEKIYRGSSAHYFVGHKGEVWQCVEDKNIAWHCGALKYKHKTCRNSNSIGVELCCLKKGGKFYFTKDTENQAALLVKELMKKYDIPVSNVIRHYDVTGKKCPAPYVDEPKEWEEFKALLGDKKPTKKTTTEIAKEVLAGKWGNGTERKKKLTAAGYNYATIQKKVNELLK